MGEVLWAPWRMQYILADKTTAGCLFCEKHREHRDTANLILWRTEAAFVMMNRYPYNNGHLMVVPIAHVPSLTALAAPDRAALFELTTVCEDVLQRALHPHGFNIGINLGSAAGAGVADHLHLHIVPRWQGDTNYMTVVGEIRVIPQHLDETYRMLLPYFQTYFGAASPA